MYVKLIALFFVVSSVYIGGYMPILSADVYGRGVFAVHMIFGAKAFGFGVVGAAVGFSLIYRHFYQTRLQHIRITDKISLFLITVSLIGPPLRYFLEFSNLPLLALLTVGVVPFIVLQIAADMIQPEDKVEHSQPTSQVLRAPQQPPSTIALNAYNELASDQQFQHSKSKIPLNNSKTIELATKQILDDNDDEIYSKIADEIEFKKYDKGLWTRLYAESDGDEIKTRVSYIKRRYDILIVSSGVNQSQIRQRQQIDEENLLRSLESQNSRSDDNLQNEADPSDEMLLASKKYGILFFNGCYWLGRLKYQRLTDAIAHAVRINNRFKDN